MFTFFCLILNLSKLSAAFQVQAPQSTVVGVYGSPVLLGCVFTPSYDPQDTSLLVTWQTVVDSRVVHSFYHGRDQLDLQSTEYHHRTGLFHSQMRMGNASLKLDRIGPGDEGRYICSVNNAIGTGKTQVQLKYAAFYTEPHLSIQTNASNVTFLYESEGYPAPEVEWTDGSGRNLTCETNVSNSSSHPGLLSLRSQIVVQVGKGANFTFSLKNPLLEQVIHRPVTFIYVSSVNGVYQTRHRFILLLPTLAFVLLIMSLMLLFRQSKHGSGSGSVLVPVWSWFNLRTFSEPVSLSTDQSHVTTSLNMSPNNATATTSSTTTL